MQAKTLLFFLVLSSFLLGIVTLTPSPISAQARASAEPPSGTLVDAQHGWLLINQRLYWTESAGSSWRAITPPSIDPWQIRAVSFLDAQHGRLVLSQGADAASLRYALAFTDDAGASWRLIQLSLYSAGDLDAQASAIYMQWIDAQTGWVAFRRATSANFSVGSLFMTTDGGATWSRSAVPIAEQPYFVDARLGWMAGGPAGADLYRTQDGGKTWQPAKVSLPEGGQPQSYLLPKFRGPSDGLLAAIVNSNELRLFATKNGGDSWSQSTQLGLGQEMAAGARPPVSLINSQDWVALVAHDGRVVRSAGSRVSTQSSMDPQLTGITQLDMPTATSGWAWHDASSCSPKQPGKARQCSSERRLLRTEDGGLSWQTVRLPEGNEVRSQTFASTSSVRSPNGGTLIFVGQGFDKCEVAALPQLQDWATNSPYEAVNLYIGGALRGCTNSALTPGYLSEMAQQGWFFIPTWVGPQAPCNTYSSPISYDTGTAYSQGVNEANQAIAVLRNLGLAYSDGSGAIVYYDIENYNETNSACRNAVTSFLSGWSARLQSTGNKSGAYGGASDIETSWWAISPPIDSLWFAHWIRSGYDGSATVSDDVLSDTLWTNHQRIKQYTGGHTETWGSTTLTIDNDVIDGPVATYGPPDLISIASIRTTNASGVSKFVFKPGDSIGYEWTISNTSLTGNLLSLSLALSGECGPFHTLNTNYYAPVGTSSYQHLTTLPVGECSGIHNYQVQSYFGGYTTTRSTPIMIDGYPFHSFVPLIRKQ